MNATRTRQTLSALIRSGDLDGYENGTPPGADPAEVVADRLMVESRCCRQCAWDTVVYRPFRHPQTGSQIAFAVCTHCGDCREI